MPFIARGRMGQRGALLCCGKHWFDSRHHPDPASIKSTWRWRSCIALPGHLHASLYPLPFPHGAVSRVATLSTSPGETRWIRTTSRASSLIRAAALCSSRSSRIVVSHAFPFGHSATVWLAAATPATSHGPVSHLATSPSLTPPSTQHARLPNSHAAQVTRGTGSEERTSNHSMWPS